MRLLYTIVAAVLSLTLLVGAPVASAATPDWSGLDARSYSGPIAAPGALIATEPMAPALSVAGAARTYRILYSTTDQHNSPAVSTAAVFVPRGAAPVGGWPVIAWAHGTVGLGDDCTPSALPRIQRDNEYLSHWLDQGYVVVGSDYTGLGTPGLMSYLNSVATAHAIIDSVVAAHHMDLPLSPRWALVGQSQGGAAAVASARWATEFSQGAGLDYRGVVATGTPANIDDVVITAGPDMVLPENLGPIASAYTAYILAGFREARPDIDVNSVLTGAGLAAAKQAETLCTFPLSSALTGTRPADFFSAPLASLPGIRQALADYMGTPVSGYDRPIFLGVGLKDRDVPPSSTLKFADQLKANGQDVTLKIYPDDDHSSAVLTSMADSTPFLRAQLAG
ncbi:prolyl oligopeptidase family serine peptidase [Mycobacterium sp. CBMA293]|uniref:alpha/beta hydrolase family protein n=1 Tax=unclassified Mycolicibacterium TaxID=2636767 RepID=UPI0012DC3ACF|nr:MULTISPECIES: prolyl oligopeptidase family serine peptidase [unclassified Mycolicibacterium]MUL45100.1 prolyl oligopeptidase family serine peptidase [Mycolicibacterium sp. CBMA 360]MUL57785.1 prolyl oligopeptidase family serine peptidase [Mycolicibacterium sp. CBMA 335]MUL72766.1 prolyl oligopeptidase family serine peptidase [Mycolicibacterium sp. CBMA 311]MUL96716.1 prolyl oligopeptidase family serine peptidase [Mycolicibacterium sp. CBMA 230]MUM07215.1 alpha/beta hydrolase [Mycolicibacter